MTLFPIASLARFPRRQHDFSTWIDQFFSEPFAELTTTLPDVDLVPPLNVAEDHKAMTITVELPGMTEKEVKVDVTGKVLTISGERKWEDVKKDKNWHRVESRFGSFTRTLTLPNNLKTDAIDAVFQNGMLTLTVPKVEPSPATKVKIRNS